MEEKNDSFKITVDNDLHDSDSDSNTIYIDISGGSDTPAALDIGDTMFSTGVSTDTIDLSGISTITLGGGGGIGTNSIGNFAYSNVSVASGGPYTISGMDWNNSSSDVVINKDGSKGVKLLATLELWSEILGLPLVYDKDFDNEILNEVYKSWIDVAKKGKIKESKKFKDQFDIIEKLTRDEKKDNE